MEKMMKYDLEKIVKKVQACEGDSDAHILTMLAIGLSLKSKNILEIGVREGVTTAPLLMLADLTNGFVNSVDISETSFVPCKEHAKRWKFNKSCSIDYLKNYVNENGTSNKFDLVYLDGWHSYEHVKAELEYLDMLVSPSSIILVHDLMYANSQPHYHSDLTMDSGQWAHGGPYRAVAELNKQFWEFSTIPANNGLTILRKKYTSKY